MMFGRNPFELSLNMVSLSDTKRHLLDALFKYSYAVLRQDWRAPGVIAHGEATTAQSSGIAFSVTALMENAQLTADTVTANKLRYKVVDSPHSLGRACRRLSFSGSNT
jgi:hypothetical protein